MFESRAVVLGGGGVAGIAWEIGLLGELLDQGIDLNEADLVVGTSAGSVVGAALRFGQVAAAVAAQQGAADRTASPDYQEPDTFDGERFMNLIGAAGSGGGGEKAARARLGQVALKADTALSEDAWVGSIRSLVPYPVWPDRAFGVTAVDAEDGSFRVFDAGSGVDLALAVTASCTVPTVWPPVHIDGRAYMDGGMRSGTNADVAEGNDRILVISCGIEAPQSPFGPTLPQAIKTLEKNGQVFLIEADAYALQAFGTNMLLDSTRRPSLEAGRRQAKGIAEALRRFWEG
ncbi:MULTISPECIES: patatin-like phospholipase family protein [unclassified Arthrobacter]|uniref:patatin-like phospholipase family protein n=1 Tax=unclassified Arthrobacter TaxID=235627 RepID=UPI0024E040A0|nr:MULTISPECIES: patatin-like phospholipase family protein [unclassified Arthrobacter]MCC9146733.1 patatin-like phospholipase family protein [Arthrobacter sp. zg-Y919]MDK1277964.1 patatin-like phospholipase family protein [Arthrobacter sp. zg.Y919]WIB03443.1 patatin-like phospholipase family protein [Arthrobacter sp. zg-Y919]